MTEQVNWKSNKLQLIGYGLIILAIVIGLITRIIAVFQYITFDIGPDPDQIKDAFISMKIWQGDFPTLGPPSSIGGHHIPPLYYYIFFIFTLLGSDPVFQAFPNALFSFLSIPLLMYLIYQLLTKVELPTRIFLSGLAGIWYSVIYGVIFIVNFQWNPSSISLFLLMFILLYKWQMESKASLKVQAISWIFYGISVSILVSLHSATLFLMPLVFILSCLLFEYRNYKQNNKLILLLPVLAVISSIIALLPYWIGEIGRNFSNTKLILKTIFNSSNKSSESGLLMKLWEKITTLIVNYFQLAQHTYFFSTSWFYWLLSIIFLSLVTYLGIRKFKGNQNIWNISWIIWVLFLLAASNLSQLNIHYTLLILFAPIILTVVSLAYLDYSQLLTKICAAFIGICIVLSCSNNLVYDYHFLMAKYGSHNLMSTSQLTQILKKIPANSTICDPKIQRKRVFNNQYNYIDTFVTHNNFKIVDTCQSGDFVIHPKRVMFINDNFLVDSNYQGISPVKYMSPALWPIFEVVDNGMITRNHQLFLETDTAYVYILQ